MAKTAGGKILERDLAVGEHRSTKRLLKGEASRRRMARNADWGISLALEQKFCRYGSLRVV